MSIPKISILPATQPDIPILAKISGQSFETDRHTLLKEQASEPYDHEKDSLERLSTYITSKKCVLLKAVDDSTGEILGFAAWGFRGLEEGEIFCLGGKDAEEKREGMKGMEKDEGKEKLKGEEEEGNAEAITQDPEQVEEDQEKDPLKRLNNLTSSNLSQWMETLMPPGTRCMFIISMSVSPVHQGKRVGSALLKWGTTFANEKGIFIWVHSSEGAVGAYEKAGFEVIGELNVDLDAYAPRPGPPPKEVGGELWGHYVFSYLKYVPGNA